MQLIDLQGQGQVAQLKRQMQLVDIQGQGQVVQLKGQMQLIRRPWARANDSVLMARGRLLSSKGNGK